MNAAANPPSTAAPAPVAGPLHTTARGRETRSAKWLSRTRPGVPSAGRALWLGMIPFCALLLLGCRGQKSEEATTSEDITEFYFEPIGSGTAGSVTDTTEVMLRSSEEWDEMASRLRPLRPFPPVDFSQVVVLVAAVPATSGGYRVEFESVEKIGNETVATYRLIVPGADCLAALGQTLPFQAISVRRFDGSVRFVRKFENVSCTA